MKLDSENKDIEKEKCIRQQKLISMRTREVPHKQEDKEKLILQNETVVDTSSANIWIRCRSFSKTGVIQEKMVKQSMIGLV